jgi:hypothetical protein
MGRGEGIRRIAESVERANRKGEGEAERCGERNDRGCACLQCDGDAWGTRRKEAFEKEL